MQKWQCRVAPSLGGGFAGTPEEVWGTLPYTNPNEPCVFFGMYGLSDFQVLWNHDGERAVLWAGSDIRNYLNDYWLDSRGEQRIKARFPQYVEHYVENSLEAIALESMGIYAQVVPSFLGEVTKYPIQPRDITKKRYYTSVSGDDFELYGWYELRGWSEKLDAEIHCYGNKEPWNSLGKNVIVHGRVSQEQMDEETKTMTGALRLTRFDGFSEILAKSILWGQQPLSPYIHYPWLNDREAFLKVVNRYPWNAHLN